MTSHPATSALHAIEAWGGDHIARAPRRNIYPAAGFVLALGAPLGLFAVRHFALAPARPLLEAAIRELAGDALTYGYLFISTTLAFMSIGRALGSFVDRLHELSITDPLTGLFNRRAFQARLNAEVGRARRYGAPLAMLVIDIDRLKSINDQHGHETGDLAVEAVAQTIFKNQRRCDVSARIGGDEFAVVLPETSATEAVAFADRVRQALASMPLPRTGRAITVSVGISELGDRSASDAQALASDADSALYVAKTSGRDRAILAPPSRALSSTRAGVA